MAQEECVQRVGGFEERARVRGLAIGRGIDEKFDESLAAPAEARQFGREPVEQFRMARQFAARAEIVFGFHERAAEEMFPKMIRGDAARERMRRLDEPAREIEAVGAGRAGLERREHAGRVGRDFAAGPQEIAADVDVRLAALLLFQHDGGNGGRRLGRGRGVLRDAFVERAELGIERVAEIFLQLLGLRGRAAGRGNFENGGDVVGRGISLQRRRRRGRGQAEARERVRGAVALIERENQPRAGGNRKQLARLEDRRVRAIRLRRDGPAGFEIGVDGVGGGVFSLRKIGGRILQCDDAGRAFLGEQFRAEFGQHEIAALTAADGFGFSGVGKNFEANAGDALEFSRGFDGVNVRRGRGAGGVDDAVGVGLEQRAAGRGELARFEGLPRDGIFSE